MNTKRTLLLLAIPCALVACKKADTAAAGGADTTTVATAVIGDTVVTQVGPTVLAIAPVGGSGASGQASLTPAGSGTDVKVDLAGMKAGPHAGHIHKGTCAAPGDVVQPLPEIVVAADGKGTASVVLAIPMDSLTDGQHVVAYHEKGGTDHGPPVACGQIASAHM
jgi:Cu/Zn superoxide dismutase